MVCKNAGYPSNHDYRECEWALARMTPWSRKSFLERAANKAKENEGRTPAQSTPLPPKGKVRVAHFATRVVEAPREQASAKLVSQHPTHKERKEAKSPRDGRPAWFRTTLT